jgi:hypothetical protein
MCDVGYACQKKNPGAAFVWVPSLLCSLTALFCVVLLPTTLCDVTCMPAVRDVPGTWRFWPVPARRRRKRVVASPFSLQLPSFLPCPPAALPHLSQTVCFARRSLPMSALLARALPACLSDSSNPAVGCCSLASSKHLREGLKCTLCLAEPAALVLSARTVSALLACTD